MVMDKQTQDCSGKSASSQNWIIQGQRLCVHVCRKCFSGRQLQHKNHLKNIYTPTLSEALPICLAVLFTTHCYNVERTTMTLG